MNIEEKAHEEGRTHIRLDGRVISAFDLYEKFNKPPFVFQTLQLSCRGRPALRIYSSDKRWEMGAVGSRSRYSIEVPPGQLERQSYNLEAVGRFDNSNELLHIIVSNYPCFYAEVRAGIQAKHEELNRVQAFSNTGILPNNVIGSYVTPYMVGGPPRTIQGKVVEIDQMLEELDALRGPPIEQTGGRKKTRKTRKARKAKKTQNTRKTRVYY
jgi:hypothetical protein